MKFHHHLHVRKRREPYPARTSALRLLDGVVLVVGILGPIFSIPQILLIYVGQQAAGVSPESWAAWALLDIPWIIYGLVHRERPIVITYTLWLICNTLVFVGALLYR